MRTDCPDTAFPESVSQGDGTVKYGCGGSTQPDGRLGAVPADREFSAGQLHRDGSVQQAEPYTVNHCGTGPGSAGLCLSDPAFVYP